MQRWHGLGDVPGDLGRSVVTIGVFDGVHRGHRRVVERVAGLARELGAVSVAVTFEPHPEEVVRPGSHPVLLTAPVRRAGLLGDLGVDAVCTLPFTLEFSRLEPDEFVRTVLAEGLRATRVVVGEDFRFGHGAAGDVETLRALGEKYDFEVEALPLVREGEVVSSTYVRELLAEGDVETAAAALGRPHRVEGVVVRGHRRGRALGFPTANVESPPHTAIPADGVYAGWLRCTPVGEIAPIYGDECWPAAISIGTNPTFDGVERTVEAYALDRDDLDLYGAHVAVDFVARLRPTLRFDSIEALIEQMRHDVDETRRITSSGAS
ncbi:bifunctional riboflavin kinase/FAD synthetase [Bailinhaonella thermotolerans]|uniref:Riboflavin biosynthesis protein n=1 Tax=Bailinhaonella thermotolerans TaxID=1070861 RepID=A0A3A4ABD8_9ACTN|nr:bifunctional riboflavin kinase/FAD synthetase [Bailinhaonella thermotolerans]RJL26566.1 bifunctional riboflavin kinase/FAD synthetase [Bailinhaonella thermotolerans]